MKKSVLHFGMFCISLLVLSSCAGGSKYTPDSKGFESIQKDLISRFGEQAYYTNINIMYTPGNNHGDGVSVHVTETADPASLKMQEWGYDSYNNWKQHADVTLEVPEDVDPKEFMFQLGGKFDLKKIGDWVELSAKKIAEEKKIENAILKSVLINTPDDEPATTTTIFITMAPENGGTSFNFNYDLDGNLLSFDY